MRVIHGIWAHGALCLWAEDPDLPPVSGSVPQDVRLPRPHPFACQAAELADMLAGWPGAVGDAARKAVHDELTLQLPSVGGGPLASPELIRPEALEPGSPGAPGPARRGRVSLAGWRVPVLALGPAAALEVLGGVGAPDDAAATAGGSLAYLAAVARFAADLAARGRVLPVLADEGETYAARWRPVLGGADAQRAHDLAAAMPPSCRAADGQAPGTLLSGALDGLADAAARARLPASLLPQRRGRTPARLPVAERYVLALTTTDARLEAVTPPDEAFWGEVAELAAELDAWRDGAQIPAGPVRTCFRLAEPATPEADPWRVEFALQSAEDPSLMISAADIWAADVWAGHGAAFLGGAGVSPGGDPVEELLAGLGAAARLFGELEDALREAAPAQVELDTPGAFRFLKETGPLLAGAGFGVLLPDWVRKARLGLKLTTRSQSPSGTSVTGPCFRAAETRTAGCPYGGGPSVSERLQVIALIDALGWEYIRERPFLDDVLPYRTALQTVLGFSSGAIPTILTGLMPERHGHWNLFYYDPQHAPFWWLKAFNWLPKPVLDNRYGRKIIKELGRRVFGLGPTFECCVSPNLLPYFNFSERRDIYAPKGIEKHSITV